MSNHDCFFFGDTEQFFVSESRRDGAARKWYDEAEDKSEKTKKELGKGNENEKGQQERVAPNH